MPLPPRIIFGYHGCDLDLARRVVCQDDELKISTNEHDWLGAGIYFWEDSPKRALQWADVGSQMGKYKTPGVLGAVIDPGFCLNLIEPEYLELVRQTHHEYLEFMKASNAPLPKNAGPAFASRNLDCAVFQFLHQTRELMARGQGNKEKYRPFQTIRSFFAEGNPLYPTSGIRERDHIQICVRDPKQIIGYFLPRT